VFHAKSRILRARQYTPFPQLATSGNVIAATMLCAPGGNGSSLKLSTHVLVTVCSPETQPLSPPVQLRYALSGSNSRAHKASGAYLWSRGCWQGTRHCSKSVPSSYHTPLWQTES